MWPLSLGDYMVAHQVKPSAASRRLPGPTQALGRRPAVGGA